jgi:hypothetical protein
MKNQQTLKKNYQDLEDLRKKKKPKPDNKFDPARKNKKHYLNNPYEHI